MKDKFPNGLKAAMEKARIGPSELARAVKTSKQNISRWADGERELGRFWAEKLADPLSVAPEELIFGRRRGASVRIPVVSWVSAGRFVGTMPVTPADVLRRINVANLPAGDWIAFEVNGDSMNLVVRPGAIIIVNRADNDLNNEKYYVFSTEDGEATFKLYRSTPKPRLQPQSTNPDHETMPFSDEIGVVGRVHRAITELA